MLDVGRIVLRLRFFEVKDIGDGCRLIPDQRNGTFPRAEKRREEEVGERCRSATYGCNDEDNDSSHWARMVGRSEAVGRNCEAEERG